MDIQLDPARDDLPLMANTSHILVKHYVLDLDVDFESQVIEGTIVLFLEDGKRFKKQNSSVEEACQSESNKACKFGMPEPCHIPVTNARTFSSEMEYNDFAICSKGEKDTSDKDGNHDNQEHASGISSSKYCCDTGNHGSEDFLLVLDCCDLSVLKVEEVDVAAVPGLEKFTRSPELTVVSEEFRNQIVHELVTLPANRWREQLDYYACCSQAPGCGELLFDTDTWSLQIRKTGAQTATDFPHAIRIWYKTKPEGRSVTWTSDQSGRPCVYTVGSPINNRALFPCQEPPVAMSTWQATVRAAASFVLMSGENSAKPTQLWEGCSSWYYYVTMPMPASTFTIAVGYWTEMKMETCSSNDLATERPFSPSEADFRHVGVCSHMEYPCRFQNASATTQEIIPHRVFAPVCLTGACQETLLRLIPPCLSAAHSILGTHPFSRLDVLIVPANFPSLGMASPHIVFLSQSILTGGSHLCGTRLCHEIAHAWFGLAIGARDWTEEWLSEGFATHLEDVFWAAAQQLDPHEAREQQELRACLRWRRLQDEMQCSPEEMQVLRPSKDKTGHTSDSGASVIKHGLNPEKIFMQVHYLKGYFLLRFLTKRLGDETYFSFLRKFVHTFHGQLILSQDFLQMLLENIPEEKRLELSVENIYQDWLESSGIPKPLQRERRAGAECRLARQVRAEVTKWIRVNRRPRKRKRREKEDVFEKLLPDQLVLLLEHLLEQKTLSPRTLQSLQRTYHLQDQDAEVRHRWCELIVKHKFTKAYKSVERFLQEDQVKDFLGELRPATPRDTLCGSRVPRLCNATQALRVAMGVYLYGELMVSEDARQQQLARRCFERTKEQMDRSSAQVVAEMLF
ncbi:aminopeptidase O isoform X2 [Symphalangus syndactylus]|uniref:aminopeptidase O isoform X2 n=1 Tax=Symphalangus syndactylus TaxID=9590 RepID=UPI0024418CF5|nr:aminopeptidase O isoform X2 [Symphalangus syndactylus]